MAVKHKERLYAPVAFIVLSQNCTDAEDIITEYHQRHTENHNIPSRIIFMEELPLTASNKVDYQKLAHHLENGANI